MGIGKQETVTFEQFQATRKKVTGKDMNDEPMHAYTYLDTFEEGDEPWEALHIEICEPQWGRGSKYAGEGKYYILIGTFDWRSDDLESLERRLYKWAVSEEYCHDPSPKTYEFEWSRVCSESGESTVEAADIVEALEEATGVLPDEFDGMYDREETIHRIREEGTEEWIDLVDGNLPVAPQPTVEEIPASECICGDLLDGILCADCWARDERTTAACSACGAAPIMGFDTPSGILCADCANERHDESEVTVRERNGNMLDSAGFPCNFVASIKSASDMAGDWDEIALADGRILIVACDSDMANENSDDSFGFWRSKEAMENPVLGEYVNLIVVPGVYASKTTGKEAS